MSKFCTECGAPISENAKFCRVCGAKQVPAVPAKPVLQQKAAAAPKNKTAIIIIAIVIIIALIIIFIPKGKDAPAEPSYPAAEPSVSPDEQPSAPEPEDTAPDVPVPEDSVPEGTEPENTLPEVTLPEETAPDIVPPEQLVGWLEGYWINLDNIEHMYDRECSFEFVVFENGSYSYAYHPGGYDRFGQITGIEQVDETSYNVTLYYEEQVYMDVFCPEETLTFPLSIDNGPNRTISFSGDDSVKWTYMGLTLDSAKENLYVYYTTHIA